MFDLRRVAERSDENFARTFNKRDERSWTASTHAIACTHVLTVVSRHKRKDEEKKERNSALKNAKKKQTNNAKLSSFVRCVFSPQTIDWSLQQSTQRWTCSETSIALNNKFNKRLFVKEEWVLRMCFFMWKNKKIKKQIRIDNETTNKNKKKKTSFFHSQLDESRRVLRRISRAHWRCLVWNTTQINNEHPEQQQKEQKRKWTKIIINNASLLEIFIIWTTTCECCIEGGAAVFGLCFRNQMFEN